MSTEIRTWRVFKSSGEKVDGPINLLSIIWTGSTSAGDTCTIKEIDGEEVWEGRADGSNTYLGINFPDRGIRSGVGFEVQAISSGKVFLYLRGM